MKTNLMPKKKGSQKIPENLSSRQLNKYYVITSNVGSDSWVYKKGVDSAGVTFKPTLEQTTSTKMSYLQVEARVRRYTRMLQWFAEQPELAPLNICHCSLLTTIYNYLVDNVDTWGTEDTRGICALADGIVALYDVPVEVVDLTQNEVAMDDSGLE